MHKFILNSIQINQSNYIDLCSTDLRIRLLNLILTELLVIDAAEVSHGICGPGLRESTRRAECAAFATSATEAEQSDLRSTSDTALLLLLGFAHGLFFLFYRSIIYTSILFIHLWERWSQSQSVCDYRIAFAPLFSKVVFKYQNR